VIGLGVAGLAVVLLVLDQTTDLPVPYGYDGSGFSFLIGGVVALLVVILAKTTRREGGDEWQDLLRDGYLGYDSMMKGLIIGFSRPVQTPFWRLYAYGTL
jgi:hypothetical protein